MPSFSGYREYLALHRISEGYHFQVLDDLSTRARKAEEMCRSKAEGGRRCQGSKGRRSPASANSLSGVAPSAPPSRTQRSREAILRDAKDQLGDYLDAVVDAAPVHSTVALVSAADADIANQVADAITETLQAHGCPRGKWVRHLLCGALAAVAKAMKAGEDLAKTAVTNAVRAALTSSGVPRLAAGLAARAAVDTLMKMTPVRHWEDVRRAVQLLGVSMCPDVAEHSEVEQYCLQPLASQLLSDVLQEELAGLTGDSSAATG